MVFYTIDHLQDSNDGQRSERQLLQPYLSVYEHGVRRRNQRTNEEVKNPEFHPELVGEGIECSWGHAKRFVKIDLANCFIL